ncbi:HEAT repeat domain-containing protein [Plectonema cf. radiosum LEGE 06105]|uniref:HEAT repeat domain-containing protein n=1 Tax=Plectonema cf. radiosum LEGE 06105 TaxID=945769 RepID=A0A8J7FQH3_9CYAN|nr:HEAT repeat domain-containing protein [Plectonema radiosum]MBE9217166.1 HEAT repeat domain-containing protein [Plectonema cf. radiosum LEGE 06105]
MIEPSAEEYSTDNAPPLTPQQAIVNLQSSDLSLRYYAAWWLGKFRVNNPEVVDTLIAALDDEADRTELGGYPLRRNAARALGKLSDNRAVPGLIKCLECSDFYVREAAAQSLEMLGDARAIPALLKLLDGGVAAAIQIPGRPHLIQPYEAVLEALGAIGATVAIDMIQPFLEHPVIRVQCAAARAMYQLTNEPEYGERLVQVLQNSDLKLRRMALSDLGAIGYMKAADTIAIAAVENSFKLIALKGLLEHQLKGEETLTLNDNAIKLMQLMDSLL